MSGALTGHTTIPKNYTTGCQARKCDGANRKNLDSSLSYLRKFPIDTLKIDQSFVRQIATADETTIVSAIISMGRSLKLRVVAEGVETQEELAFLQAHNCDEAQGYYFSRPLAPHQFALLLKRGLPESLWQPSLIAPVHTSAQKP